MRMRTKRKKVIRESFVFVRKDFFLSGLRSWSAHEHSSVWTFHNRLRFSSYCHNRYAIRILSSAPRSWTTFNTLTISLIMEELMWRKRNTWSSSNRWLCGLCTASGIERVKYQGLFRNKTKRLKFRILFTGGHICFAPVTTTRLRQT